MTNRPWTPDEIDRLTQMRTVECLSVREIAHRLGTRTPSAVSTRCRALGLSLPDGMTRGHTPSAPPPVPDRPRWPHQQALHEAWRTGQPIRTTARALRLTEDTVRGAYLWFGARYAAEAEPYDPPARPTGQEMARMLAPVYEVSPRMIIGPCRSRAAVTARTVIARVLHGRGHSLVTVARAIGRRDHTTVLHLLRRSDPDVTRGMELLR